MDYPTAEELAGVVKQAESDSLYGGALYQGAFRNIVTALVAEANIARQRISWLEKESDILRGQINGFRDQLRKENDDD